MNLEDIYNQLEKLENDLEYYTNRLEEIKSLIMPQGTSFDKVLVDGRKHTEKYLSLTLPKGTDVEYGLYDIDGFLSTYEKKDGNVEFKLVVTDLTQIQQFKKVEKTSNNPFKDFGDSIKTESNIGEQIEIDEDSLPF